MQERKKLLNAIGGSQDQGELSIIHTPDGGPCSFMSISYFFLLLTFRIKMHIGKT